MFKVNVLMSTYNGEKYLKEQLLSILRQEGVEVVITIRDDGSTDDTVKIIKEMMQSHKGKIVLCRGKNEGYKRSFMKLLKYAEEADYYAFSDQDDVWMENKLISAVEMLEKENARQGVVLYASSDIVTDENLKQTGFHDVSDMPVNLESFYSRARIAGCTYCFSAGCLRIASRFANIRFPERAVPDHDFILGSVALSTGKMIIDSNAYIYHRRTAASATSGGNGILQRIKVEYDLVFGRVGVQSCMAAMSLKKCDDVLLPEAREFFTDIVNYRSSRKNTKKLLKNKQMKSGVAIGDLETRIKIILGNY